MSDSQTGKRAAVTWAPSALADMANIIVLGSEAEESLVMRGISQLLESPHIGEKSLELRPIYRRFVCGRYQIVYRVTHGKHHWTHDVTIVAVRRLDEQLDEDL